MSGYRHTLARVVATATLMMAAPAVAQHAGHGGHDHQTDATNPPPSSSRDAVVHEAGDEGTMEHGTSDQGTADHSHMHHGPAGRTIDHARMDHSVTPPAAGLGPARAADAIWGSEAMRASREELRYHHGGQKFAMLRADRLEYRARDGADGYLWDVDGWYGGDIHRIAIESEGEGEFGGGVEAADIALLYRRAINPWFDMQAGVRQDLTGPTRTYLDVGIQGLVPYLFEVQADVLLSDEGEVTAIAEVELDQRITQRLILQPRGEVTLSGQDVPELGLGAGISSVEAGLRLRYEITREFAPYVGIAHERRLGDAADYARAEGDDPSVTSLVAGVRFWF